MNKQVHIGAHLHEVGRIRRVCDHLGIYLLYIRRYDLNFDHMLNVIHIINHEMYVRLLMCDEE